MDRRLRRDGKFEEEQEGENGQNKKVNEDEEDDEFFKAKQKEKNEQLLQRQISERSKEAEDSFEYLQVKEGQQQLQKTNVTQPLENKGVVVHPSKKGYKQASEYPAKKQRQKPKRQDTKIHQATATGTTAVADQTQSLASEQKLPIVTNGKLPPKAKQQSQRVSKPFVKKYVPVVRATPEVVATEAATNSNITTTMTISSEGDGISSISSSDNSKSAQGSEETNLEGRETANNGIAKKIVLKKRLPKIVNIENTTINNGQHQNTKMKPRHDQNSNMQQPQQQLPRQQDKPRRPKKNTNQQQQPQQQRKVNAYQNSNSSNNFNINGKQYKQQQPFPHSRQPPKIGTQYRLEKKTSSPSSSVNRYSQKQHQSSSSIIVDNGNNSGDVYLSSFENVYNEEAGFGMLGGVVSSSTSASGLNIFAKTFNPPQLMQ